MQVTSTTPPLSKTEEEKKSAGLKLKARLFCGLTTYIKGNLYFINNNDVIHPVGRILVIDHFSDGTQNYMKFPEGKKEVTIMAISPDRAILALAEKSDEKPTIAVYSMATKKRLKTLGNPLENCVSKYFEVLTFTHDSKSIVAVTGEPDWMLIFYNWERGCIESHCQALYKRTRTKITQVACHPSDKNICVLVGKELFRMMNCIDNTWQQFGYKRAEGVHITAVCWVSSYFTLAGTYDGRLLAVEHSDLRGIYEAATVEEIDFKRKDESTVILDNATLTPEDANGANEVRALTACRDVFAYSCATAQVFVFEREEKTKRNSKWIRKGIFTAYGPSLPNIKSSLLDEVQHLAFSPDEKKLLCSTRRTEIYYAKLDQPHLFKESNTTKFKRYFNGYHQGPIAAISSAIWKATVLTVGAIDRTAIIWNYKTKSMMFRVEFEDDIFSASIHPTGFYCLIGFKESLNFMIIFIDTMKVLRQIDIKACPLVEFTEGGHRFAAVNGETIEIYSSLNFKCMYILSGHTGPIWGMRFVKGDFLLFSCGQNGPVVKWDMAKGEHEGDLYSSLTYNFDICATKTGRAVYSVGPEGRIVEFLDGKISRTFDLHGKDSLYSVALSNTNNQMYAGGAKGTVIAIDFPITTPISFKEYFLHTSPIKKVMITYDEETLISVSEDGALCVWDIVYPGDPPDINEGARYLSEVVINHDEWTEKKDQLKEIKAKLDEIDKENENALREITTNHENTIKETHKGYISTINDLQNKAKLLEKTHLKDVDDCTNIMQTTRAQQAQELQELQASYDAKITEETARCENMLLATREFIFEYWDKIRDIEQASQQALEELAKEKNEVMLKDMKELACLQEKLRQLKLVNEATKLRIEDDCEREIVDLRTEFEEELAVEEEKYKKLSHENTLLKKRSKLLDDKVLNYRLKLITMREEQDKLKDYIHFLRKEIASYDKIIEDKTLTAEKKSQATARSRHNQEEFTKEKYIWVMRIQSLKEKLKPIEEEYQHVMEIYNNLLKESEERDDLIKKKDKIILGLTKRAYGLSRELKHQRDLRNEAEHLVKKIKSEIHTCATIVKDPDSLKSNVINMFNRYVSRRGESDRKGETVEFMRQRRHLEASVKNLKSFMKRRPRMVVSFKRISNESTKRHTHNLLKEITQLRHCWADAKREALLLEKVTGMEEGGYEAYDKAMKKYKMAITNTSDVEQRCRRELTGYFNINRMLIEEIERLADTDMVNYFKIFKDVYTNFIGGHVYRKRAKREKVDKGAKGKKLSKKSSSEDSMRSLGGWNPTSRVTK